MLATVHREELLATLARLGATPDQLARASTLAPEDLAPLVAWWRATPPGRRAARRR
jgi:hypothetical protein